MSSPHISSFISEGGVRGCGSVYALHNLLYFNKELLHIVFGS